ncbi:MAG: alpha/beta fold hydrolase [Methanomassiliicoccales archaeon]|nr:alpha/beta fold hydrolase [Methanomassiliicoccales archaeon]NYT15873.1 alpha/beta fold hydrolase [Methanomassiliicoccales archaeon]
MGSEECNDQTLTIIGMQLVGFLANGNFERAHTLFATEMKAAMTPHDLEAAWKGVIQKFGLLLRLNGSRLEREGPYNILYVTGVFASGSILDVKVVFNEACEIAGVWFVPAQSDFKPPEYADPTAFEEKDCTVGNCGLPGKTTIPTGKGPFPAVVLVHGSGPNDMDETLWETKVFRDLAWGLSSDGIAVLRYDKRPKARPDLFDSSIPFTIMDEVIEDALAGVELLTQTKEVDPSRIFVLGHSLGGMMAPRIASLDDRVAGIVMMAGDAAKLEDAFLEQIEYLVNLDGIIDENEAALLVEARETVTKIKELDIGDGEMVLGAGRSYWDDLASYDQMKVASSLKVPMLILQGERDYQVTMEDYDLWKKALSGKIVKFISYPTLNHMMIEGEGPSTPQEYTLPGHLAQEVVEDIVDWIGSLLPDGV